MILIDEAIYKLYPNAVTCVGGEKAFDVEGNEISYDKDAVEAKLIELQAEATLKVQSAIDTKASELAKLAALGLTEDEIKSILGVA